MSPIIAGIATFFSVGAFIFYAVAASGYSQDSKVLKGSKWFYYGGTDPNYGDFKFYFGLKGFLFSVSDDDFSGRRFFDYDTFSDESNDDSLDDTMDKCDSSGKSAIGLTVVACIFSFITIIANGAGGVTEEIRVKAVSAVLCDELPVTLYVHRVLTLTFSNHRDHACFHHCTIHTVYNCPTHITHPS